MLSFSKIKGSLNVRWDFVVPNEDPYFSQNAPLGRWVNEVEHSSPCSSAISPRGSASWT